MVQDTPSHAINAREGSGDESTTFFLRVRGRIQVSEGVSL